MRKNGYYSQRQFAKITGISTVTLSKLVKEGVIKLQPNGTISGEELRKLVIVELRKKYADSLLLFQVGSADSCSQAISNVTALFEREHKKNKKIKPLLYYKSIDDLVDNIVNYEPADLSLTFLENRYMKHICKEFLSRYKQAMQTLFISKTVDNMSNTHDTLKLNDLPNGVVYNLFMSGVRDANYDYSGVENMLRVLDTLLDERFNVIVDSLQLKDASNAVLFERKDLTSDIIKDVDTFYDFLSTKLPEQKDTLGNTFYMLPNKVEKLYVLDTEKMQSGCLKDNIRSVIHNNRVFTAMNLNLEYTDVEATQALLTLTNNLTTGVFGEVMFTCTRKQYEEYVPDLLRVFLDNYESNGIKLTFIND